jgi:SET domain-containing protein
VYLAKIHTVIRYGFLSKRKTELELQTDVNGKGKFTGLPHEVKKLIEFTVEYKGQTKTITHDPATNCHAAIEVELGSK